MRALGVLIPIALVALLTACADKSPGGDVRPTAFDVTPTPTLPAGPTISLPRPANLQTARVTKVVDGDTIEVEIDGMTYKLRYIGVDTPETVDPNRPMGCYGHEAAQRNLELVVGQTVGLEKDVSETDEFGRLLRYVWVGDEMVNATLVREGYAEAKSYPPDTKHQEMLDELENLARTAGRGLWGEVCANRTPLTTSTQTPPPGIGDEVCDFSGTNQAVIKGNISSSDEKIYHVPGQDSYDETGITESRGERWFCTEQEAVGAGWRKSRS